MKTSSIRVYIECILFLFSIYITNLYLVFIKCRNLMAHHSYYIVFEGRKPSIYESWPNCQRQVNGFMGNSTHNA